MKFMSGFYSKMADFGNGRTGRGLAERPRAAELRGRDCRPAVIAGPGYNAHGDQLIR
jgi:hypothetical protein